MHTKIILSAEGIAALKQRCIVKVTWTVVLHFKLMESHLHFPFGTTYFKQESLILDNTACPRCPIK